MNQHKIIKNPKYKKPPIVTMYFCYADFRMGVIHECNDEREPLCGTGYSMNNDGEFVYSDLAYDLENFFLEEDIDPYKVTCKRCLAIAKKKGQ